MPGSDRRSTPGATRFRRSCSDVGGTSRAGGTRRGPSAAAVHDELPRHAGRSMTGDAAVEDVGAGIRGEGDPAVAADGNLQVDPEAIDREGMQKEIVVGEGDRHLAGLD